MSQSSPEQTIRRIQQLQDEIRDLQSKLPAEVMQASRDTLELAEYRRYGRQMILDGFGLPGELADMMRLCLSLITAKGQLKLKRARILVIGAGGLGCPVLLYLAGAGVGSSRESSNARLTDFCSGHISIVDHDTVELSNFHRQVLHTEHRVGMYKCESAKAAFLE